ncbi:glycosyltransferase [Adhaeribacter aquaticus]|uniref:glycosyltransferase n=1 Tax=Adhaeribacter aquaticus TaxID=299567 RepID=UPI000406E7C9|nr:glycosyltransferase [Adhaeribacter aquaticus]
MKELKILHVINDMNPKSGGVCQAVRTMISGLKDLKVENEVVSLDAPDVLYLKQDSFPVHAIGPGKGPWSYSSELIPWLEQNFSRFDVVILHGLWLYNGFALHKAIRQYKKKINKSKAPKILVMPHGMLDPYFQEASGRKLKKIRNWIYWKLIESRLINKSDGLLFTCEEERRLAHKPFNPYKPKKELVIGLGVEKPPVFTKAMQEAFLEKCPELRNQPYLLFLSRIHEKKGVDILIKAYAEIRNGLTKIPPPIVGASLSQEESLSQLLEIFLPKLVIAGPGLESSYGASIQEMVKMQEGLEKSIIFPGMLSGDAKWGAFYNCDAFVLPSHQENFGIAVVEALACSKPVLISNQINIWREITEAGGGLVADDTLTGVKGMLQNWFSLPTEEKSCMADQALATYNQYFAINPAAKKLKEALAS